MKKNNNKKKPEDENLTNKRRKNKVNNHNFENVAFIRYVGIGYFSVHCF